MSVRIATHSSFERGLSTLQRRQAVCPASGCRALIRRRDRENHLACDVRYFIPTAIRPLQSIADARVRCEVCTGTGYGGLSGRDCDLAFSVPGHKFSRQ